MSGRTVEIFILIRSNLENGEMEELISHIGTTTFCYYPLIFVQNALKF